MTYKGWHSRGYLPHFDSAEAVQFVTFRLADSLLRAVVETLSKLPDSFVHIDQQLDSGLGTCWLSEPRIAELVEDAFLHFDGDRYRLLAWCIMPNHVHVIVEPIGGKTLSTIVQSWKSFTAKEANRHLSCAGSFWNQDYFDRYMRSESHLETTIAYVENNPVKAGLVSTPDAWRWSSGRLR
jgi:putative transposase